MKALRQAANRRLYTSSISPRITTRTITPTNYSSSSCLLPKLKHHQHHQHHQQQLKLSSKRSLCSILPPTNSNTTLPQTHSNEVPYLPLRSFSSSSSSSSSSTGIIGQVGDDILQLEDTHNNNNSNDFNNENDSCTDFGTGMNTQSSIHYLTNEHDITNGNVRGMKISTTNTHSSSNNILQTTNDHNNNYDQNNDTTIIGKTLHDLSNQQLQLLAYLEEMKSNFNQNNNNNDNHNDYKPSSSSSSSSPLTKEKEYLIKLWKIANKMDMKLHEHYQTNAIQMNSDHDDTDTSITPTNTIDTPTDDTTTIINLEHFNTVIEAWKVVMDAYNNCIHDTNYHSLPVGIPQRATRLLDTMEKLEQQQQARESSLSFSTASFSKALSIDTYNTVLEIWSSSKEHNLDTSAEMIFRRIEDNKIDVSHSMVDRFANDVINDADLKKMVMKGKWSNGASDNNGIQPNAETMKIMLRAWCKLQDQDEHRFVPITDTASVAAANDTATTTTTTTTTTAAVETDSTNSSSGKKNADMFITNKRDFNAKSRKGSSVFNASWYLIQMQGLLESGRSEFEPSLDDYTKIFKAWSEVK